MKTVLAALAATVLAAVGSAQNISAEPAHQPLKIIQTVAPAYPPGQLLAGTTEGEARIAISVDETGRLTEWLVLAFSDRAFADAALAALRQWRFEPARRADGPVSARSELTFNFEAHGVVISHTVSSFMQAYLRRLERHYAYAPCARAEIDQPPALANFVPPAYGKDMARRGIAGSVTVEFYIDETGAVRLPAIVASDHDDLSALTVDALRHWKFAPPTRNGHPVLVKVQQRFDFDARG